MNEYLKEQIADQESYVGALEMHRSRLLHSACWLPVERAGKQAQMIQEAETLSAKIQAESLKRERLDLKLFIAKRIDTLTVKREEIQNTDADNEELVEVNGELTGLFIIKNWL